VKRSRLSLGGVVIDCARESHNSLKQKGKKKNGAGIAMGSYFVVHK